MKEEKEETLVTLDEMANEVLQNLQHATVILGIRRKLAKSQGGWTPKRDFVFEGEILESSLLRDLFNLHPFILSE